MPIPENLQQTKVVIVKGTVRDKRNTDKTLFAELTITDIKQDDRPIIVYSNKDDGKYIVILNKGKICDFSVKSAGYLFYSRKIDLTGLQQYKEINEDILLEPIVVGANIVLNNMYLRVQELQAFKESKYELNRIIRLMKENPTMRVEISGHTDNIGTDKANQKLSMQRAQSVVEYLINKGISKDRLEARDTAKRSRSRPIKAKKEERKTAALKLRFFHITTSGRRNPVRPCTGPERQRQWRAGSFTMEQEMTTMTRAWKSCSERICRAGRIRNEFTENHLRSLYKSEELYRLLAENSYDVIWTMTLDGRLTYVSPSVTAMTGYTPEELHEVPMQQFIVPEYTTYLDGRDRQRAAKRRERIGRRSRSMELQQYAKDGSVIDIEVTTTWILDDKGEPVGIQGSTRDIRKRKMALMALEESEERYRALFDRSLDIVFIHDFEGHFIDANSAVQNALGYTKEELLSADFQSLISDDQMPTAHRCFQRDL